MKNFLAPSLKNFLYFRKELAKPESKQNSAPKKSPVTCNIFVIFKPVTYKQIHCDSLTAVKYREIHCYCLSSSKTSLEDRG